MKKALVFSLLWILSGITLMACERGRGVQAGAEPDTYQPRAAPPSEFGQQGTSTRNPGSAAQEMKGALIRVDLKNNTLVVRPQNGTDQTFKVSEQTVVEGIEHRQGQPDFRSLAGRERSEVTVRWKDESGVKMATSVHVMGS